MKNTTKHLIKFLKEKNALIPFMINLMVPHPYNHSYALFLSHSLKELEQNSRETDFILDAFHWSETSEKYEYWQILHNQWIKYLILDKDQKLLPSPQPSKGYDLKNKYKNAFVQFLRDENALIPFICNLSKHRVIEKNLSEYLKNSQNKFSFIWTAFVLSETSEGWNHWLDLNNKWEIKCTFL